MSRTHRITELSNDINMHNLAYCKPCGVVYMCIRISSTSFSYFEFN